MHHLCTSLQQYSFNAIMIVNSNLTFQILLERKKQTNNTTNMDTHKHYQNKSKSAKTKTQWGIKTKVHMANQGNAERAHLKEKKSCAECKGNNKQTCKYC